MKLNELSITNFCSCADVTVQLSAFTPVIGYNNAGKSNTLRAIFWLLRKSVLPATRFTDPLQPVIVTGIITDTDIGALPPNQQVQMAKYIVASSMTFRRIQDAPGVRATDIRLEVLDPATGNWVLNPTGIDNAISGLFPEPIFIEAMDDASEDVSQFAAKNTIGLLLKNTMEQIRTNNSVALTALTTALSAAAAHLNGPQRIAEFALFESAATTALNEFFPGLNVHLGMQSPTLEDVVKTASLALSDAHGVKLGFTSFGHGTQRTVQMALINLLANQVKPAVAGKTTTLLLIDEPELYLHPHAIELLRESLQKISENSFQIVFTTHSPLTIGDRILDTIVAYKDQAGRTKVRQRLANAAAAFQGMAHHASVVFSLQNSSYLLFSENILIVEGKTEKMLIPDMYRVVRGMSLAKSKTCLIEVCGSKSIGPTIQILSAVGFRSKAIVDLDYVFKVAPSTHPALSADPDYITCKAWFAVNSPLVGFKIGADGFPEKNGAYSAAAVFELVAVAMPQEIQRLATQMLQHGLWVWTGGAIESHLGIGKNDSDRLAFTSTTNAMGNVNHAAHPISLTACMNWI